MRKSEGSIRRLLYGVNHSDHSFPVSLVPTKPAIFVGMQPGPVFEVQWRMYWREMGKWEGGESHSLPVSTSDVYAYLTA